MTALELLKAAIPNDDEYKGSIELPVDFDDINVLTGSTDKSLDVYFDAINEGKKLDLRPSGFMGKLAGKIFGFYLKPSYETQNDINQAYADALTEYREVIKEKNELIEKVNSLQVEILKALGDKE